METPFEAGAVPVYQVVETFEQPVGQSSAQGVFEPGTGPVQRPQRGLRGVIASWLLTRQERRHVAQASHDLLALYCTVEADHPDWSNRELYKHVVMTRADCDSSSADAILQCAEESFAEWPVRRELTFCDVVHYRSVTEFLSTHVSETGMHSDIARVVTSHVPHHLCSSRAKG